MRILLTTFLILLSADSLGAKTNYKKWLEEEVVWIISSKEKVALQSLKTDDEQEEFVRKFWERRDPTPSTPRNEYKEEHYRRYEYALKNFQEGIPGWKTDRGRVYILHGPPAREYFYTSDSRIATSRPSGQHARTPNTIVWSYHEIPRGRYYRGEINLVFQPNAGISRQNFALGESGTAQEKADQLTRLFGAAADQTWLEADVRYQLIVAGPPGLVNARGLVTPTTGQGEAAKYIEDLFRSPGDALEEPLEKADQQEKSKQLLREAVASRLAFGELPFDLISRSFRLPQGEYRVQVQVDLPCRDLSSVLRKPKAEALSRLELYCALMNASGGIADEFIDSLEVSQTILDSQSSGWIHYLNSFTVGPGSYILKAAVRGSETAGLGYREQALRLDAPEGNSVRLSDLYLTNRVQPVDSAGRGLVLSPEGGVILGDAHLLPNPERKFTPSESLVVYFQVFLPSEKKLEDCDCSVSMNFIAGESIVKSIEPRKILEANSTVAGLVNFATSIPLKDFPIGEYTLQVQVIDHSERKFSIKRASFSLAPSN